MSPGDLEFTRQELARAGAALREARTLLAADGREGAASRLYYAAFHAGRAALTVEGRHSRTHAGQLTLFEQVYGPAEVYGIVLRERIVADYGRETYSTPIERLQTLADDVASFIDRCSALVNERSAAGPDEQDSPPDL